MTEREFEQMVEEGNVVDALCDAPFGYRSVVKDHRYTFTIEDGRIGQGPSLDIAVLRALRADTPSRVL